MRGGGYEMHGIGPFVPLTHETQCSALEKLLNISQPLKIHPMGKSGVRGYKMRGKRDPSCRGAALRVYCTNVSPEAVKSSLSVEAGISDFFSCSKCASPPVALVAPVFPNAKSRLY